MGPADVDEIGADDVLGIGAGAGSAEPDEGSVLVGFVKGCGYGSCGGAFGGGAVDGCADAGGDGDEVWREGDADGGAGGFGQFLFDFAEVAVAWDAVGADAFIAFAEEQGNGFLASGTRDAAHAEDADALGLDEASLEEREEGQQHAGGVASGSRDQSGAADGVGIDFRETVDRLCEEVGCRVGVVVEFLVGGRVIEAEIGAQVDDAETAVEQGGGVFVGDAVGEGEEGGIGSSGGDGIGVGGDEGEAGGGAALREAGEDCGERSSGVLSGGEADEFGVGVAEEDAQEFDSGVSTGSEDGDFGW